MTPGKVLKNMVLHLLKPRVRTTPVQIVSAPPTVKTTNTTRTPDTIKKMLTVVVVSFHFFIAGRSSENTQEQGQKRARNRRLK